jgi:hypothetical protein
MPSQGPLLEKALVVSQFNHPLVYSFYNENINSKKTISVSFQKYIWKNSEGAT